MTDRMESADSLVWDELLFRTFIDTAIDGILVIDGDGTLLVFNDACERLFQFRREEVLGRNIKVLMPPPLRDHHDDYIRRYKETGQRNIIGIGRETQGLRKDGTAFPIHVSVGEGHHGATRLFVGIIRDLTVRERERQEYERQKAAERKLAEDELRASKAKLEAALSAMSEAIFISDMDGNIIHFNEAFAAFHRFKSVETCPRSLSELSALIEVMDADKRPIAPDQWPLARTLRGETVVRSEYNIRRKDTGETWIASCSFAPVRDGSGAIIGGVGVGWDITEVKAYRTRMQELRNQLSHVARVNEMTQISAGIAHELNQPLAALVNYANVAKRYASAGDLPSMALASDAIAKAGEQAMRAGQIIRRLRDFVERREINCAVEDINALAEDALVLGLIGAKAAGISTKIALNPRAPSVFADRVQVQQVLVNLLRNAVEAMAASERRELTLTTSGEPGGHVEVTVADTGPGIDREVADRLFMPFVTTKPNGMGIGLAISRAIIEAHGGTLDVKPNEGGGAKFQFTLPAAKKQAG